MKRFLSFALALMMLLSFLPSVTAESPHTHTWKEASHTKPTCTETGKIKYTCSCGRIKWETIPALGHEWASKVYTGHADCTHYGVFYWVCARCGAHSDNGNDKPLGHDWDAGVVTKEPTETEEGIKTYTCKRDPSHTMTEVIPATGETEILPALYLEITWDENAGEEKREEGAVIPFYCKVTNTGNVPVYRDWYSDCFTDIVYPNEKAYYPEVDAACALINPGQSWTYTYNTEVDADEADDGFIDTVIKDTAKYVDESGNVKNVWSNEAPVHIDLTTSKPAEKKPELKLVWDYDTIWRDGYWYDAPDDTLLYPGDIVCANVHTINTGSKTLLVYTYISLADRVFYDYAVDGILSPDEKGPNTGMYPPSYTITDCLMPGTDTEELLGTITVVGWAVGYDRDTLVELCESNEVIRTWKVSNGPAPKTPDGSTDYCSLSLEALGDTGARYTLHTCPAHLETASAAQALSLAGDWAGAAELWRGEIEALYAEMPETATAAAEEDKAAFFDYAEAVAELFGDEKAEELMRLKCAELCCMISTAPIRLPSSLLGKYTVLEAYGAFDISGREISGLDGSDSEVTERYAGLAAETMAGTRALLDQAQAVQTESLFVQAAQQWKSALDEKVDAADKNANPFITTWSMLLDGLCDADSQLYSLLYLTKPYIVEEHVMDLYKDAVLLIDSIG